MHRTNKCLGCYKHWSIFVCENTENGRWTWDLISLSLRICTTDKHFIRVLVLISFSIRTMSFQIIDDICFFITLRTHLGLSFTCKIIWVKRNVRHIVDLYQALTILYCKHSVVTKGISSYRYIMKCWSISFTVVII